MEILFLCYKILLISKVMKKNILPLFENMEKMADVELLIVSMVCFMQNDRYRLNHFYILLDCPIKLVNSILV